MAAGALNANMVLGARRSIFWCAGKKHVELKIRRDTETEAEALVQVTR
jgi:hypothetical protein